MLIFETLLPIFGLIVIGLLFKRFGFPGDAFWVLADRLTYYALLPALLFSHLATASFAGLAVARMAGGMVLALVILASGLLLTRRWIEPDRPRFTSLFQGSIRPNSYVGIAAGGALYGAEGLALTAIAIAAVIPLVNLLSVLVLGHYLSLEPTRMRRLLGTIVKNPLILACVFGLGMNGLDLGVPETLGSTLGLLSRAALPLGLLSVGSGLNLRSMGVASLPMVLASVLKLLVAPLLTGIACSTAGVGGAALTIAVLYAALPGSASSYILAAQMGGDSKLMAAIITVETIASMFTLPLLLNLLL